MENFRDFRIRIRLSSSAGTPWQSDTLQGYLAYHVALTEGEDACNEYLKPFRERTPPFILSDAFPEGILPKPLFASNKGKAATVGEYAKQKQWQKATFVTLADFERLRRGKQPAGDPVASPWKTSETPHAAIDRSTWTTSGEGGNFFSTWEQSLEEPFGCLDLYLRAQDGWEKRVRELLEDISRIGFGRDKSTGAGQFQVEGMEPWDGFSFFEGASGFVSLSTFAPAENDPVEGYWNIQTKFGRLGERAGADNPFKRPLIQLVPGSVFRTGEKPAAFYGRVVEGISPARPEAVQICLALPVPCLYPEN